MDLGQERILVTGGAGFLGRHVFAELVANNAARDAIIVPRRQDYDLTDPQSARRLFDDARPTVILHLAAEVGGIGANLANPGRYFYANLAMGLHLIEQARQSCVKKFVQVGTVCAYPKHAPVPFQEADLWNGYPEETNAPYGVAKKALLVMLQAYRKQYGLIGIYLLPVNLYGPGDHFDLETSHVIPALIRKFVEAKRQQAPEVTVWGTGSATREFLYVEDCARGIVAATRAYDDSEPVNLGSGEEISIRGLAEKISGLVGYQGLIRWDASRPDGQPRRRIDTRRARARFGFQAATSLDAGLKQTVAWFTSNQRCPDSTQDRADC